jgi:hypothetical protein
MCREEEAPTLKPDLSILPPAQLQIWHELAETPKQFTLYDSTALALRLGHRTSVDFDFFSNEPFDPDQLSAQVSYLRDAERIQVETNTLTCRVLRGGPVLVSFFGGLGLGQVEPPDAAEGPGIAIASLADIAGAKAAVIQKRAEAKDYLDIDAILQSGVDLPAMLAAGRVLYGRSFNPMITLKALSYFDDVPTLAAAVKDRLRAAAASTDPTQLLTFSAYAQRSGEHTP